MRESGLSQIPLLGNKLSVSQFLVVGDYSTTNWFVKPNPDDRINGKLDFRKLTEGPNQIFQPNIRSNLNLVNFGMLAAYFVMLLNILG